jgi:tetratricopeptide (TPR) repeat protein
MRSTTRLARATRPVAFGAGVLALALGVTVAATAVTGPRATPDQATVGPAAAAQGDITDPAALVTSLQTRLRAHPRDAQGWAGLGFAYVEQARITADPTYYPRAQRALGRASRLAPQDVTVLSGQATLAAARHDFRGALRLADEALAGDPYAAQALAVRADALTELGRYGDALAAADRVNNLKPGASTFSRLSYQEELRGHLAGAEHWMARARQASSTASSYAFAAFHEGELARAESHQVAAARHYDDALRADPAYVTALVGRARSAMVRGDLKAAERDYTKVVDQLPLTEYVVELGELYAATGRPELAAQQWAVARASGALAKANGVVTDLETSLFEADHGSRSAALTAARTEWRRRHSIHVADALGWALHVNGRDAKALRYARFATRLGTQDARLLFHRGSIEAALGRDGAARQHLTQALRLDDGVSPWREQRAHRILDRIAR